MRGWCLAAAAIAAISGCQRSDSPPNSGGGAPTAVRTVEAKTGDIEIVVRAVGQIRAVESVTLASEVAGLVQTVHFEQGAPVRAGDPLVDLDDRQARAELSAAQAARDRAARQVERFEQAAQTSGASITELDTVRTELEQAEAQLQLARLLLEDHRITAPFDGRVGLRLVSPGAYVRAGDPLTTLTMVSPIDIEFSIPEQYLAALRPGLPLSAASPAYERTFEATVSYIAPQVEPTTRTVLVMGRAPNAEGLLRPGMYANVELVLGMREGAVLVPESALQYQGSQAMLYVVESAEGGERARQRRVRTGERRAGAVEIVQGVAAGERVVTQGLQRIRDGAMVSAEPEAGEERGGR